MIDTVNRMRILFLGDRWYGSCARACCEALRRSGHDVADLSPEDFGLKASSMTGRVIARILEPVSTREYNGEILRVARAFKPDFVLVFKGPGVASETVRTLRKWGVTTYNYFPDSLIRERRIVEALPEYDCIFDTKRALKRGVSAEMRARERVVLPHGYDPELHRPVLLDDHERKQYGCDVGYVGNHAPRKEKILLDLVRLRPEVNLRIWGHRWLTADSRLHKFVAGAGISGTEYVRAVSGSSVSLGIMGYDDKVVDETSTRTFEIPACGRFMLHERTPEVLELFEEGKEIECFDSAEEIARKVDHYRVNREERERIAAAGYRRCVPAYSYDKRVEFIVRWHMDRFGHQEELAAGVNA